MVSDGMEKLVKNVRHLYPYAVAACLVDDTNDGALRLFATRCPQRMFCHGLRMASLCKGKLWRLQRTENNRSRQRLTLLGHKQ